MSVNLQNYKIEVEIPKSFFRYFEERGNERVIEVVLVYNGVDRWDTIIEPDGMRTDPKVVTIDYNHKGVNTGAYLRNVRVVENYEVPSFDQEPVQVLEKALVGNIHIPKDAEMFYFDKNGHKQTSGNLYEAISRGHVNSVSVEFRPYKGKQVTTKEGITIFKEWDLIRLSVLDVAPGQPYSGIKIIRSLVLPDEETKAWDGNITNQKIQTLNGIPMNEDTQQPNLEVIEPKTSQDNSEDTEKTTEESTDEKIVRLIKDNEEMRDIITKLTERMDVYDARQRELEEKNSVNETETTNLNDAELEEEQDAQRVLEIARQLEEHSIEEVSPVAGDPKRQLGNQETLSNEEKERREQEIALRNYRKLKGFNI